MPVVLVELVPVVRQHVLAVMNYRIKLAKPSGFLGLRQFAVARNWREREAHSSGRGGQPLNRNHHASTTSH
ncbi:hypothetical protein FC50_GL000664 [Lacticaseibacillus pantheris DSM 15945 = JCM 12539 = NBRC 106106]|uniref:Uncharacterized protein n=1 Tax=Lacticaseibacillus pantheris DSM 15945 = JCM 12539 = NBRC 106106 TaxID=1423783 RepID=A0A0R1U5F3_9LACO|nr:hypothetical protein FC50_GL000664 [Lacticaseibacillus pantheris DSM 15945 = JCM 12539 = NBRC 106106]